MSFRIGAFITTPSTLVLPLALAFFWVISAQRLYPGVARTRFHTYASLAAAILSGALGAWAYGTWTSPHAADPLHAWLDLRFGSFGGYWGALAGALAYATLTRHPRLRYADALVPGILAGGSVARIGCLFTGCCRGIAAGIGVFQPFRPWPLYDIAALLVTWGAIRFIQHKDSQWQEPGGALCLFLLIYGVLRFSLEFLRDLPSVAGPFTAGHLMAAAQVLAGAALFVVLFARGNAETSHGGATK